MKISLPTTVDKVVAGDAGTSVDNPIDALIIGAGPSGKEIFQTENPKNEIPAANSFQAWCLCGTC